MPREAVPLSRMARSCRAADPPPHPRLGLRLLPVHGPPRCPPARYSGGTEGGRSRVPIKGEERSGCRRMHPNGGMEPRGVTVVYCRYGARGRTNHVAGEAAAFRRLQRPPAFKARLEGVARRLRIPDRVLHRLHSPTRRCSGGAVPRYPGLPSLSFSLTWATMLATELLRGEGSREDRFTGRRLASAVLAVVAWFVLIPALLLLGAAHLYATSGTAGVLGWAVFLVFAAGLAWIVGRYSGPVRRGSGR